jgi:hypothetical protein
LRSLNSVKKGIEELGTEFSRVLEGFRRISLVVQEDMERSKQKTKMQKGRLRSIYAGVFSASALFLATALLGFLQPLEAEISVILLQGAFGGFFYLQRRNMRSVSRIYTPAFDAAEVALLMAGQSIYQVILTGDLLA